MLQWPHAPLHKLNDAGTYFVTVGTDRKLHFFNSAKRLDLLRELLWAFSDAYGWLLQSWALFSNHYHFVAISPDRPGSLRAFLRDFHSAAGREVNRMDGVTGRTVFYQFWDKQLTFEKSYLARLNYVHQNAVHHGLVKLATNYRWSSAGWFERNADSSFVKTVGSFKTDQLFSAEEFVPTLVRDEETS